MRVLVTGADGFLGQVICAKLKTENFEIIKLVSKNNQSNRIEKNLFEIDITEFNLSELVEQLKSVDAIVHTAGLAHQFGKTKAEKFYKINVEGTRNISNLAAKLKVKHFIHISSVSVYGNCEEKWKNQIVSEESICNPIDHYANSKFEAEKVCREILKNKNTKLTILRLVTVIGSGDKGNVLRLIRLIDSKKFFWFGKGKNRKSLIHKKDVADAISRLLKVKNKFEIEIFNLTGGVLKMNEIVKIISLELNTKILPIKIPSGLIIKLISKFANIIKIKRLEKFNKSLEKWVAEDVYSGKKIFDRYGFESQVSIKDGLKEEIKWFRNKG